MAQPVRVPLIPGSESEQGLKNHIRDRIRALRSGLREFHETHYVTRRRIYEAKPAEDTREFPFHGASNIVIPIVAIHTDTLLARIMSALVKTAPPWVVRQLGSHSEENSGLSSVIEEFLQYVGFDPGELDLYRVYHDWCSDTIKLGTGIIKVPYIKLMTDTVVPSGDGSGSFDFVREVEYEGPRPEKVPLNQFYIAPNAKTIELSDFKVHRVPLQRHELEERAFLGTYDKKAVEEVIRVPDGQSGKFAQQQAESDAGMRSVDKIPEWDIWECHMRYRLDNHYVRMIVWYHEASNQILRAFFNYYPGEIFIASRLFYRDDMFFGYGFAETLASFQEELSQIHNQRRDNLTVANTKVWRVDPDSKLHQGYRIYPSAMIPAAQGEIEALSSGDIAGQALTIEEERMTLDLAERRSGVSPPMQGSGAGSNTKRGVYTAMGTLSLLQEGNTRTDLNVTDMRYAHTKLGRLLAKMYAEFGIGSRALVFGEKSASIIEALGAIRSKKMALPIYASTASVNREVEKQNDLLLSGVLNRHFQMVSQMMQSSSSPMAPPEIKEYMSKAIKSADLLMKTVIRHFGYDEVDRYVPEPSEARGPVAGLPGSGLLRGGQIPPLNEQTRGVPLDESVNRGRPF